MCAAPSAADLPGKGVVLAVLISMLAACGREAPQVPQAGPRLDGSGSAQVKYANRVRVMEEEQARKSLMGTDSTGAALLFDSSDRTAAALVTGDVLVIKGMLARKVLATETDRNRIVVLTQPAALGEVIEQGSIRVKGTMRFAARETHVSADDFEHYAIRVRDLMIGTAHAQGPAEIRRQAAEAAGRSDAVGKAAGNIAKALTDGWQTSFTAEPSGNRLNLKLTATKDVGGFRALVKGEGYLADFDFDSAIDVEQSVTQRVEAGLRRVNGLMNVDWSVAKDSPGGLTESARIKLPASISVPLAPLLDGLPLFLEVSAAVIVNPAITGGKEFSRGAFRITYDGYQHFRAKEGTIDADGNISGDIKLLEQQNISALAPMGMVVAFAAPRIELSFGLKNIFKMKDIKDAADKVDLIAQQLAQRVLTPEQYQRFQSGPTGSFTFAKAADMALKSDAAAYFEFVTTSALSASGMSAITPCSRTELGLSARVGASATAFGQSAGKMEKTVFEKKSTEIEPRGTKLCEAVGIAQ